jgi:hypothetical protein
VNGYDEDGNLRTLVYPTGQSIEYLPDPSNLRQNGRLKMGHQGDLPYKSANLWITTYTFNRQK